MPSKVNRASAEKFSAMKSSDSAATAAWIAELREAYSDPLALLRDLEIAPSAVPLSASASATFRFRVTRAFARRMQAGNPRDPLLLQVLPLADECQSNIGFGSDPVGDRLAARSPGLLHKYSGRALLIMTGGCAIHCRYCFRREFPYIESVGRAQLAHALAQIAADRSISEVILSGGDPLLLDDAALSTVIESLAAMPHIRRVRVHSRLPIVLPNRMTFPLIAALTSTRLPIVLVIHANHAQELDASVAVACRQLRQAGITLLNQAVLLHDINDDADTLVALSDQLFAIGVLPYYLHLLDRVRGAAHFEVAESTARDLQARLRARLPGYLVPRFVREIAGESYKRPLGENEPVADQL